VIGELSRCLKREWFHMVAVYDLKDINGIYVLNDIKANYVVQVITAPLWIE